MKDGLIPRLLQILMSHLLAQPISTLLIVRTSFTGQIVRASCNIGTQLIPLRRRQRAVLHGCSRARHLHHVIQDMAGTRRACRSTLPQAPSQDTSWRRIQSQLKVILAGSILLRRLSLCRRLCHVTSTYNLRVILMILAAPEGTHLLLPTLHVESQHAIVL